MRLTIDALIRSCHRLIYAMRFTAPSPAAMTEAGAAMSRVLNTHVEPPRCSLVRAPISAARGWIALVGSSSPMGTIAALRRAPATRTVSWESPAAKQRLVIDRSITAYTTYAVAVMAASCSIHAMGLAQPLAPAIPCRMGQVATWAYATKGVHVERATAARAASIRGRLEARPRDAAKVGFGVTAGSADSSAV